MSAANASRSNILRRYIGVVLGAAAPVLVQPAWAQATGGDGQEARSGLEEIIVTARRREETIQTQPLSVTALTGDSLEQLNIRRLDDIRSIPNVTFTNQPGFINTAVIYIRGIGEQDPVLTNDPAVALYIDGVPIARAIGSLQDLVEPERIEILRGPQGSLFGRNTTGGAVSITLPKPTDDFGISARAGYATDNEMTIRGIVDTGHLGGSRLKAKIAAQYHKMDGYVENGLTDDEQLWPGADETTSVYLALHGDVGSASSFDLRGDWSRTFTSILSGQTTYASQTVVDYFGASPAFGGDPYIVSPDRLDKLLIYRQGPQSDGWSWGTSLTFDVPVSDAFDIKSITAYRKFNTQTQPSTVGQGLLMGPVLDPITFQFAGIDRVTPYALERGMLGRSDGDLSDQHQFTQEFQFSGNLGERHKYVAGLFYFDEKYSETYVVHLDIPLAGFGVGLPVDGGLNYSGESESYAVYASDTWTPAVLDNKLELTGGVRFTHDKKTLDYLPLDVLPNLVTSSKQDSFEKVSGDITVKYQWSPDFMTYLRWANAYKSGGFSGRDDPLAPGFEPEVADNYEVGFKSEWLDRRLRLNGDVFYTKYKDKQVTTFAPGLSSGGINASHVVNAGEAEYPGYELELVAAPTENWQFDMSYGRVWPKYNRFDYQPEAEGPIFDISDQARFAYFPDETFSVGTTYTVPLDLGNLSFHVDYSYKSEMYFHPSDQFNPLNEAIKAGPQKMLNASINLANIDLGGSQLTLSLYGKNLLDEEFRTQGVDYEIIPGSVSFGTNMFTRPLVVGFNATWEM
jgi:iron complex outermembrane receptor protein